MTSMKFISHRGNVAGRIPDRENSIPYIREALALGFNVEIDVWLKDSQLYLGHDHEQYQINLEFLKNDKFLCHAKNRQAFELMLKHKEIHCFWHQQDTYTLTSKGVPIVYPGCEPLRDSIVMIRDEGLVVGLIKENVCESICSDNVLTIQGALCSSRLV